MSFWGKLGKIALKVAPIAAGFIPGVGPLASMAIGGLAAGASKKLEGGSWKDAALSGGIGAASGYASGKLGDMSTSKPGGIGPSQAALNSPWANPADYAAKASGTGVLSKIGGAAGKVGLAKRLAQSALAVAPAIGGLSAAPQFSRGEDNTFGPGVHGGDSGGDFGSFEYRNPNIGAAINRGRQQVRRPSGY